MKKRFNDLSLKVKVPGIFLIMMLLMASLVSGILYSYCKHTFTNMISETLSTVISNNAAELCNLTDTVAAAMNIVNDNDEAYVSRMTLPEARMLSSLTTLIVDFKGKEDHSDLRAMIKSRDVEKQTLKNIFNAILEIDEKKGSAALIVDGGYPIAKYLTTWKKFNDDVEIYKDRGMAERSWYARALDADGGVYWFGDESVPNRLCAARTLTYRYFPTFGRCEVRQLGVIAISFDLSNVEARIDTSEMTKGTQIFLMDMSGRVFYTNTAKGISEAQAVQMLPDMPDDDFVYRESDGLRYIVQKNQIAPGLAMLTAVPFDDVRQVTLGLMSIILGVVLVMLIVGFSAVALLGRRVVTPIVSLSRQMERGLVERIETQQVGNDEIGRLYHGYNRLQEKLQEMIQEAWDSAEKQKAAELRMLQMQINPHFFYNTLGTISAQALLNGQDEMAHQLTMLTTIMRYCTKNPEGLVPLKDEIGIISQYEAVQRMGSDGSIAIDYHIEKVCEGLLIPKLLIQPLVENAVIHGMDMREGQGRITVSAELLPDCVVVIRVADNGHDADVEAINQCIRSETASKHDSLGLRNVYERIQRVFGSDGTLIYRINERGETEAVITLMLGGYGGQTEI